MKNQFLFFGLASMLIGATSCSDKEEDIKPIEPGTEIIFGSVLQSTPDHGARTWYGEEEDGLNGNKVWPIYWNPENTPDHIFIYSPQALGGRNQSKFTVIRNNDNYSAAAQLTKDKEYGIQVGTGTTGYDFYGIYPAEAVNDNDVATGSVIKATLPYLQKAAFIGTTNDKEAEGQTPTAPTANEKYYMKPDMSACLMMANENNVTLTPGKPVNMIFKPFSTCIDITINGPDGNMDNIVYVTAVRVSSQSGAIAGSFQYDFNSHQMSVVDGTNEIVIDTRIPNANGEVGIPLKNGNTLNLQAFILPNTDITDLTVKVVTSTALTYSKKLSTTHLGQGQINPVILPKMTTANGTFDYSIWLSQLDPQIYISELSLPGASGAFSAVLKDGDLDKMQTKSLTDLFAAGIRVFQSHVNLVNQTSSIDGGATSIGISVNGNSVAYNNGYLTLSDVVGILSNEMATAHSEEFCVLLLSDYGVDENNFATFFQRLKTILDSNVMKNLVVTDFGPNTTIADIKGKVLIKYAVNEKYKADATNLAGTNALFNLWQESSSKQVNYSNLLWKQTSDLTNSTSFTAPAADGMLFIHNEQANPVKHTISWVWDDNAEKQIKAYHDYYNSTTHNIFGMSYLGGTGYTSSLGIYKKTPTDVADYYNKIWTDAVSNYTDKPFGWVVVNLVGLPSTDAVIQKVIEQNNAFPLKRKTTAAAAPSGDMKGAVQGSHLF